MENRKSLLAMSMLATGLALTSCAGTENQEANDGEETYEETTLTLAGVYPEPHYLAENGPQFFKDYVESESEGQITIEYYPANQLGDPDQTLNLLSSGAADIAMTGPGYMPSQMPLSESISLPQQFETGAQATEVYDQLAKDSDSAIHKSDFEGNGLTPLFLAVTANYEVMTASSEITSPEDLEGLNIRSAGGLLDVIVEELGSTPVPISSGEIFQAMERGTVDANLQGMAGAVGNSVQEVSSHVTTNASLTTFPSAWTIEAETLEALPEATQELLLEAGDATSANLADSDQEAFENAVNAFEEEGAELVEFSEEELQSIEDKLSSVEDRWTQLVDDPEAAEEAIEQVSEILQGSSE